jgi:hypothetical protein
MPKAQRHGERSSRQRGDFEADVSGEDRLVKIEDDDAS